MSFICNLFNPSCLIFLGFFCLILACLVLYFEHKMREQNHKIASMLSLVSSLAEEMNHIKMVLGTSNLVQKPTHSGIPFFDKPFFEKKTDELISVSDDDEDDDEDCDEDDDDNDDDDDDDNGDDIKSVYLDNKSIEIDKEIKLNDIDSDVENEENEENEENDNTMFFSQASPLSLNHIMASILQNSQIINMNRFDSVNQELASSKITILESDVDASELNELNELNEVNGENMDANELNELNELNKIDEMDVNEKGKGKNKENKKINNLKTIDLSSINMSTVENVIMTDDKNETGDTNETDYKKMSVQKLRRIVLEKVLSPDPSKIKKPELLKLLE